MIVLGDAFVKDRVASIVVARRDQPLENVVRMVGIADARFRSATKNRQDVVFGERPPVAVAVTNANPALDSREQALDARAIPLDLVAVLLAFTQIPIVFPDRVQDRHQVFGVGKEEYIRFFAVEIAGKALVRLAGNRRQGQVPAEPENSVTGPRIVGERELRSEARATGADRNRDAQRAGAGDGIGREFFADPANCTASFGQRNLAAP